MPVRPHATRTLVLLTLFATLVPALPQGRMRLDTLNTPPFPQITAAHPWPAPVTVGFYWAAGNQLGALSPYTPGEFLANPPNWANPNFVFATGTGSTTTMNLFAGLNAGYFTCTTDYIFPGVTSGPVTLIIALYYGLDYDTAFYRTVSPAFLLTPTQGSGPAVGVGAAMPAWHAHPFPEPSAAALFTLGLATFLLRRRGHPPARN